MKQKVKYGKVALVIFLTLLIWVWADLALDEELADKPALIVVDEAASPRLWVTLGAEQASSVDIRTTFSGPHPAIVDEKRKLKEGRRHKFEFDAVREKMNEPGNYTLNLLSFLQKDREIRLLGLKIESCQPQTISVTVVGLVKKSLKVECVDAAQIPIKDATVNPARVEMFVPENWVGNAKVQLAPTEIKQARLSAIKKTPFIKLSKEKRKEASQMVEIVTPPEEELLRSETVKNATLGFNLSANTQGKYKIEVINLTEVIGPIAIRSTAAAKRGYENMQYQVILEIDDKDAESAEVVRKKLIYNFPEEYVRNNEITLNQQPVTAQFKLVPIEPK